MFSICFPLVPTQHMCFPFSFLQGPMQHSIFPEVPTQHLNSRCVFYRFPRRSCAFLSFSKGSRTKPMLSFAFSIGSNAKRVFPCVFIGFHANHMLSLCFPLVPTQNQCFCFVFINSNAEPVLSLGFP